MTMREEFEAWERSPPEDGLEHFYLSPRGTAWVAWQAAYRAGQEEMRERAAKLAEPLPMAERISALPIDA